MNPTKQSQLLSAGSGVNPEVLVKVEDVGKKFCRSLKKSLWYGLCDIGAELNPFGRQESPSGAGDSPPVRDLRDKEFYAVEHVSFELRRGECLGLIGHNGAGKTTLLKMLNGLIKPDRGTITMRGRVGALIALGAGFNPILTGRENIYINGSVLGLSKKEIDEKLDDIIEFSEIGDFIDTPVQNYSSGMQVRLGFSIASSLSPDVLILDEVLAVGDIGFVIKCLNRVRQLTAKAAVILVSHNMQFISHFCTRVIFMDHGRALVDTSNVSEGIDNYFKLIKASVVEAGVGGAALDSIVLKGEACSASNEGVRIRSGTQAFLELEFFIDGALNGAQLHFTIINEAMSAAACYPVHNEKGDVRVFSSGSHRIRVDLGKLELRAGKYDFVVALNDVSSGESLLRTQGLVPFRVIDNKAYWGQFVRPAKAADL